MAKKMIGKACSPGMTKTTEDSIRDLINWIHVMKEEEMQDVTTRIEPKTAKELVRKLEGLARRVGSICA